MHKIVFITGGASGIGAASARLMCEHGYFVYIGDVQTAKGTELAAELGNAEFLELNVREEAHFERALARIMERHGRLDCMVNNAAIVGVLGPIARLPLEQYDYSQEVIQRSVVIGTKHAARIMQAQKSGNIINIASVAGLAGGYSPHTYAACKAAVVHFSESVALELAEDNVRVNTICPGNVATPIHTGVQDGRWLERIQKIRAIASDDQPLPRMGEPEEIAQAVLWLASDAASYVTGHALVVDGGLLAGRLWRRQPPYFKDYRPARR
jgi:NAD(P)-dependent dehydrogenase (short-subunit alcohol dehydrogenase family)